MNQLRSKTGFTLLEILIVLIILSVGASVAVFSLSRTEKKHRLAISAKSLTLLVKEARSTAILRQVPVILEIDDESSEIIVHLQTGDIVNRYRPDEMIKVQMEPMVFFPTGSGSGGEILVMDENSRYTITVDGTTGIAKIYKH